MRTITLTLTEQELQVVIAGLGELPLKHSLAVAQTIEQQVEATVTAAEAGPDLKEAA